MLQRLPASSQRLPACSTFVASGCPLVASGCPTVVSGCPLVVSGCPLVWPAVARSAIARVVSGCPFLRVGIISGCLLLYRESAVVSFWFMDQHFGSKTVMPRRGICQLCKRHRPGHRRQCVRCNKLVGPGCDPEQCLYTDYWDGTGICRECHRLARYRLLTRSTPEFLCIVIDVGF